MEPSGPQGLDGGMAAGGGPFSRCGTVLNLRFNPGAIGEGFRNYSFKDFDHGLGELELGSRLAGIFSQGEFSIKFKSKHISQAIDVLKVEMKPVISCPVVFEERQVGSQGTTVAHVSLGCHYAGEGAEIVLEYWPEREGAIHAMSRTLSLGQNSVLGPQWIADPPSLPPLDLGKLKIGTWQYRLLWKPRSGNAKELAVGNFDVKATLGQLDRLLRAGQNPGAEWAPLLSSADWRRTSLLELSRLVSNALRQDIGITDVMVCLRQGPNLGIWPSMAINLVKNHVPVADREGMIWKWAHDVWMENGHPNNPLPSPGNMGLDYRADADRATLAAALVAEHGKLFERAGNLMNLDAPAVISWMGLLDCWQQRDGGNHLAAVRNMIHGFIGGI